MKFSVASVSTLLPLIALASPAPQGPPGNGPPAAASNYQSIYSDVQSWTSAASVTSWPTASSEWKSLTSAHPLPSELSSFASEWSTYTGGAFPTGVPPGYGSEGWSGGAPFGRGPNGGWGPWGSSGSWTAGPWTSWWGTSGCPASTWSGWTESSNAPWTTWTGCTASTTASSTYTTTVSTSGSSSVVTTTGYGIQLNQATSTRASAASATGSSTSSGSGAMATNFKLAGSAAGALGVLAGAVLL